MMKRPSRDQSSGQPAGAPILTSNSSGSAPLADLTYRSNTPLRLEAHTTRRPSGDHMGGSSIAASKVSREVTPRTESRTQTSGLLFEELANAMRLSSGASRKLS